METISKGAIGYLEADKQEAVTYTWNKNNAITKTIIYAGDYETITENGVTKNLYYISGGDGLAAIYVKQPGYPDKTYYACKYHLGSILKLLDGNGTEVFKASYDAWGNRTVTNSAFNFHRGYTGHEHLPDFNLIDMNGRMYDPVLARFLSPDPFVQEPDFSQSFNRYSYCLNNPLKYTDPDGEFFFIIPYIGYSKQGGLSFGLSIGVGIPNGISAQILLGYSTGNKDFTATVSVSGMGFSAYGGYSTNAGWIAGLNYGFGSLGNIGGFNISSNLMNIGFNYSQKGGFGFHSSGVQYSEQGGLSFDPSIGGSRMWGKGVFSISESENSIGITTKDKASVTTDEQLNQLLEQKGVDYARYYVSDVSIENQIQKEMEGSSYLYKHYRRYNGIIYSLRDGRIDHSVGGFAASTLNGWNRPYSIIYMSTHNTVKNLMISLNHEFIHAWQWAKFGHANQKEWEAFKEASAYRYTNLYHPSITVPSYFGIWRGGLWNWPKLPSVY